MATPRSDPYPYPLFKAVLRKLLEAATKGGEAKGGKDAAAAADMDTADDADSAEATQRGLLELLLSMAPSLELEHVSMLWRAVRPQLQHPDPALQKKAYKVVASLAESHPSWARQSLAELKAALEEALLLLATHYSLLPTYPLPLATCS